MPSEIRGTSQPAYERLADTLRDLILSGTLQPGDRLPVEPDLCVQYGVSRSTARESLRVLSSQKLVTTVRGISGGTFVNRPGPEHVHSMLKTALAVMATTGGVGTVDNLLEVRQMLEVPAAGLAAERRTEEQLADLRSSLFDPRHADGATLFPTTKSFHVVVLEAADNPMLTAVTAPIFMVLQERFARELATDTFWRQVDKDHRTILSLIEAHDVDAARQAQTDHLMRLRDTYVEIDRDRDSRGRPTSVVGGLGGDERPRAKKDAAKNGSAKNGSAKNGSATRPASGEADTHGVD